MTNWEKIRAGFVKDGLSYRALAREYAMTYSVIQRRGIKENWAGQREEYLEENVGEKMKQVKTKSVRAKRLTRNSTWNSTNIPLPICSNTTTRRIFQ